DPGRGSLIVRFRAAQQVTGGVELVRRAPQSVVRCYVCACDDASQSRVTKRRCCHAVTVTGWSEPMFPPPNWRGIAQDWVKPTWHASCTSACHQCPTSLLYLFPPMSKRSPT